MALLFRSETFPGFPLMVKSCLSALPKSAFDLHLTLKGMLSFSSSSHEKGELARDTHARIHAELKICKEHHPWELVWTVLGRLLQSTDQVGQARKYWQATATFTANPDKLTFVMLGHAARAWEALSWLDEGAEKAAKDLLEPIGAIFTSLAASNKAPGIFNPNRIADEDGIVREGWFDEIGRRFVRELKGAAPDTMRTLAEGFTRRFTFNYW